MPGWAIALIIVGGVILLILLAVVLPMVLITMPIAEKLYKLQWTRGEHAFERGCSDASFDYHLDMFNKGMEWRENNLKFKKDVEVISDNTKLVGEYFDFGFKKAIILMPGRTETCYYACFYAPTFKEAGYNVLTIDPRAHGLSEGKILTLGKLEGLDLIEWSKLLHNKFGIETVVLYGLCGGGTASCVAFNNPNCPDYIKGFISDGMFYSFFNVYRRHIIDEKHPVYPVIWEVLGKIKHRNGVNPYKTTPKNLIQNVKVPTLFLTGEKDKFAVPEEAYKLYELSGSNNKQIHLIKNARHSHLRYDNLEDYDKAVIPFLKSIDWKERYEKDSNEETSFI